jgi:RNA ligase
LYRRPEFLELFKYVWVDEKCDGTSGNLSFNEQGLRIFAGGAKQESAEALFDKEYLLAIYKENTILTGLPVTIYGEFYAGKIQGCSHIYGKDLKFIAFDVLVGDEKPYWLDRKFACAYAQQYGLEFVPFKKIENTIENLNAERDAYSEISSRLGIRADGFREGIMIRPLIELNGPYGSRMIAKHKAEKASEVKTPREVDPNKSLEVFKGREAANEFVNEIRLRHILDKHPHFVDYSHIPDVIKVMLEDIRLECSGEYEDNKEVNKAISQKTVQLFKEHLQSALADKEN